jgi:hypothetical protein
MLNFNVDPYYDDFDPSKNYHRILFKPGRAVQGRELTQAQTILQNQITNFADHFFTQNTPIKGGKVTVNNVVEYVKLNITFNDDDVIASDFLNQVITDDTGTVLAQVLATEENVINGDPPTLVISYFSGTKFVSGSNVFSQTSASVATAISANATGSSSVASVANGVFYIVNGYNFSSTQNQDGSYSKYSNGNFVEVQPQTIILNKYSNTPNVRIGLDISEYISDYVTDSSLLDPAVGATNFQAPGADRYTIDLNLTSKLLNPTTNDDQNFVELVRVENGTIVRQVNGTSYSAIDDYFAQRTYETNGDFIVNNFKLSTSANSLSTGSANYNLKVGPGVAYVQGFRAENQSVYTIIGNRARSTSNVNNNIITPSYGNYFYVNTLRGANGSFLDVTQMNAVDFHVGGVANIIPTTTTTYNSTLAATGFIRNIAYNSSGTDANANSYIYKTHVFGLAGKTLTGTATNSSTSANLVINDTGGKFSDKANVYYNTTLAITSGPGVGDVRTVSSYNGTTKTFIINGTFSAVPTTSSAFELRLGVKDIECIVKAGAGISSNLAIYGSAAINDLSKVNQYSLSDTFLTDIEDPQLIFPLGQPYVSSVSDSSFSSLQEYRGQAFTVTGGGVGRTVTIDAAAQTTFNFERSGAAEDADSIKRNYIVMVTDPGSNANVGAGDIVHFTNSPTRTVVINAGKTTATFFALDLQPFTATVFTNVNVINGDNTSFVKKTKTLITANTAALGITGTIVVSAKVDLANAQVYIPFSRGLAGGFTQPQSLYVSDVKRIVKIINVAENATPTLADFSDATKDITSNFTFDNGQRDGYYDHASIQIRPGVSTPGGLWILFDYYSHSGGDGHFNVNSYLNEEYAEIPSYTTSNGILLSLKDSIDFRPARVNAQTAFTFKYSVTPTTSNFYGSVLPRDTTSFTSDYDFYLGRKDLLVLTKDAELTLVQGKPDINPLFPAEPSNGLVLAKLTHDPYTAYVPSEEIGVIPNLSVQPVLHKNWQMKDITDLQERVNNIEYYAALNLLEQSSSSLQIPDSLGLNRFKNGILVDNFSTYGIADTYNVDYSASINTRMGMLTAPLDINNYQLQNIALLDSKSNGALADSVQLSLGYKVHKSGSSFIVTLPYTEVALVTQSLASRDNDVNGFSTRNAQGTLALSPNMDNWIDTQNQPSLLFIDPTLKTFQATNSLNLLAVGDWQSIPGTKLTKPIGSDNVTTESQALTGYFGYYSPSTTNQTASYVTNVSLIPYIRAQQISFVAEGLLTDTPVNTFFDGKRVTRLIKKANIITIPSSAGIFKAGDIIGYKPTSGTFVKTGKILSVTKTGSSAPYSMKLYVVDDNNSTTYSTNGTLTNGFFDTVGTYVNSTDSATTWTVTHYSGKIASTGTTVSTVTLNAQASSTTNYYVGMKFNIVSGSFTGVTSIAKGSSVTITAYNGSTKVATLSSTVSFVSGDIYSIGEITTDSVGSACGVFYCPDGYFLTGERVFRVDDRIVQSTGTEFLFYGGTETTFAEGKFYAQGISQKVQETEYSPSIAAAKNIIKGTADTRNGYEIGREAIPQPPTEDGCCVVSTAFADMGIWSPDQKNELVEWCVKYLHNKTLGECFRRGYQVIGSKLIVPLMRNEDMFGIPTKYLPPFKKYCVWAFGHGTEMVQGNKFNPLSIPSSVFWIAAFMITGTLVTTKFAKASWNKLYK